MARRIFTYTELGYLIVAALIVLTQLCGVFVRDQFTFRLRHDLLVISLCQAEIIGTVYPNLNLPQSELSKNSMFEYQQFPSGPIHVQPSTLRWDYGPVAYYVFSDPKSSGHHQLFISGWLIDLPLLLPVTTIAWRVARRRNRIRAGLCPQCGYDVRASPDRCPECGFTLFRSGSL